MGMGKVVSIEEKGEGLRGGVEGEGWRGVGERLEVKREGERERGEREGRAKERAKREKKVGILMIYINFIYCC